MKWLELSVDVPAEFVEPVSHLFTRHGRGLVIEELHSGSTRLTTYLSSLSRQSRSHIDVGIRLIRTIKPFSDLKVRAVDDTDWEKAWKSHFTLLRITPKLVVKPTWIDYTTSSGESVIELDPGMAFGTGHHPSTRMCLELLEEHIKPCMSVLDLGTGSGILSIAALKLGAVTVLGLDVDPVAIRVARKNLRANGLRGRARLLLGTLPHSQIPPKSFHLVLANITAPVIQSLTPEIVRVLTPGGLLIASGVLNPQATELETHLNRLGLATRATRDQEDWTTLLLANSG